ncbi:hypothetical protein FRB90_007855, partial [Tulasnella sp. 427]
LSPPLPMLPLPFPAAATPVAVDPELPEDPAAAPPPAATGSPLSDPLPHPIRPRRRSPGTQTPSEPSKRPLDRASDEGTSRP